MNVKAIISYDGSRFHGFQVQTKSRVKTVSSEIIRALNKLNIDSKIIGSGRTDKGVHATFQVISFQVPKFFYDLERLKNSLNKIVSPHIFIKSIKEVDESFHARFDAKKRVYRYLIYSNEFSPFLYNYALFVKNLNPVDLDSALKIFIGRHNFKNFKKEGSPTSSDIRTISKAGLYKYRNFFIIYFEADGFLRSQVRMMADFALKVSFKELSLKNLEEQLECQKVHSRELVAPNGLYLSKVHY